MTAGGMTGMKHPSNEVSTSSGRTVKDANFVTVLKSKHASISMELSKLKKDLGLMEKQSSMQSQIQSTFEALVSEVRGLEEQMVDHNLAMDMARDGTDPQDTATFCEHLTARNERAAEEADKTFMAKDGYNCKTKIIEDQIAAIHQSAEEVIRTAEPAKLETYFALMEQCKQMRAKVKGMEREVDLCRVDQTETTNECGGLNEEYELENSKILQMKKNVMRVKNDLGILQMDPKEAHSLLLSKLKEFKNSSAALDDGISSMETEIVNLRNLHHGLEAELKETSTGGNSGYEGNSYHTSTENDEEMTGFLQGLDQKRQDILNDQHRLKSTIVDLLDHISSGIISSKDDLPTQEQFKEMKSEISFKARQLQTSEHTITRLQEHKTRRMEEMDKIDSLEEKIRTELDQLHKKMITMEDEMKGFDDVKGLQERSDFTKDQLYALVRKYKLRKQGVDNQTRMISSGLEKDKSKLHNSATRTKLHNLEKKIRDQEQNVFSLKEYIASKEIRTDFQSVKSNCNDLVKKLNAIAIEAP